MKCSAIQTYDPFHRQYPVGGRAGGEVLDAIPKRMNLSLRRQIVIERRQPQNVPPDCPFELKICIIRSKTAVKAGPTKCGRTKNP